MKMPAVLNSKEGQWAVIGIVGLIVVYVVGKGLVKGVGAAATAAGGVVSGNNALTQGTAYQGTGILGTLGAAFNSASGGSLASAGSSIGGWFSDLTNSYDPNAPTPSAVTRDQVVTPNYVTDIGTTTDFGVTDPSSWE
jgi:hypothetical protein